MQTKQFLPLYNSRFSDSLAMRALQDEFSNLKANFENHACPPERLPDLIARMTACSQEMDVMEASERKRAKLELAKLSLPKSTPVVTEADSATLSARKKNLELV